MEVWIAEIIDECDGDPMMYLVGVFDNKDVAREKAHARMKKWIDEEGRCEGDLSVSLIPAILNKEM